MVEPNTITEATDTTTLTEPVSVVSKPEIPEGSSPEMVECIKLKKELEKSRMFAQDLESRIQEIEKFRNTPSIEGKIASLYSDIERLDGAVAVIQGEMRKFCEYMASHS
jgi:hypothetical protein